MPKTILIVDDDVDDLILLEHKLVERGYDVISSSDPEQAILKAKAARPDLIILDEVMPKLFGSEVGMKLLEDPRTRDIPLLFLTALKTPDDPNPVSPANIVISKSEDTAVLFDTIAHLV